MADYIFEVPLTNKGRDVTDADVIDMIVTRSSSLIPTVTYENINVESVRVDKETKKIYYNVNVSPQMKLGLASLNYAERVAWYDYLIAGVAIAGAIVCACIGVVPAAVGLVVVAGLALARESISGLVEAAVNDSEAKIIIAEAVADGRITPEEGNNLLDGVNDGWGSDIMETVKWIALIGGVAIVAMIVLQMMPRRKD